MPKCSHSEGTLLNNQAISSRRVCVKIYVNVSIYIYIFVSIYIYIYMYQNICTCIHPNVCPTAATARVLPSTGGLSPAGVYV